MHPICSRKFCFVFATLIFCVYTSSLSAQDTNPSPWNQFRGPNGSGVSLQKGSYPDKITPDGPLLWKTPLSPGVSSPVTAGGKIFFTAVDPEKTLVTLAIDEQTGELVWKQSAEVHELEKTDDKPKGRLATSTCVTDGKHVVSFFGSSGLNAYDLDGKHLWHKKLGPFANTRGAPSSLIAHDKQVFLFEDHETGSFLAAYDIATGNLNWRSERALFNRSYGTPVIYKHNDKSYVLTAGSGLLTAYDVTSGKPAWFVQGTCNVVNSTPVLGPEGEIYLSSANPGIRRDQQFSHAQWIEKLNELHKVSETELKIKLLPESFFATIAPNYDENEDGILSEEEYQAVQKFMHFGQNSMIRVDPKGTGLDRTEGSITWTAKKGTPRTSSTLLYKGVLYMMKDGGVFHSMDPKTGETIKMERTSARGKYFGSPVLADNKIYIASDRGEVSVFSAQPEWQELSIADFDEPIYSCLAVFNGKVLVRTESMLYCFQVPEQN